MIVGVHRAETEIIYLEDPNYNGETSLTEAPYCNHEKVIMPIMCSHCHQNTVRKEGKKCKLCRDGLRTFKKRTLGTLCNPNFVFNAGISKDKIARFMELQKTYRADYKKGKYRW